MATNYLSASLLSDTYQNMLDADDRENETSEISELRRKGILNMCEYATYESPDYIDARFINNIPEWFSKQQSANIQNNFKSQINWSSDEAKILWSQYNDYVGPDGSSTHPAMTDQLLLSMFGSRVPGSFQQDGVTPIYTLPSRYGNPSDQDLQIQNLRLDKNIIQH